MRAERLLAAALLAALLPGCAQKGGDALVGEYTGTLAVSVRYIEPSAPPDPPVVTVPVHVTINHDAPNGDVAIVLDDGSSQCIQQAVVTGDVVTFRHNACPQSFGPSIAVCEYEPWADNTTANTLTHDASSLSMELHFVCLTGTWDFLETFTFTGAPVPP